MARYKYIGNGAFIQGLPAKDLDEDELTPEQRLALAAAVDDELYIRIPEEASERPQRSRKVHQADA